MRNIIILSLFLLSSTIAEAQIKHYLSYNTVGFQNYYNKENDKFTLLPLAYNFPNFSYKLEKNRIGIEAFYNDNIIGYYFGSTLKPEYTNQGDILDIRSSNIGISCQYSILNKKYLKINPMIGLLRSKYNASVVEAWFVKTNWTELISSRNKETSYGFLLGVNINAPIYKGIFATTTARYSLFPTAQYNKRNLIFELGLGYRYLHMKKERE